MKNFFLFLFFIKLYIFTNQKEETKNEIKIFLYDNKDIDIDCINNKCKLENTQCKIINGKQICNCYKCYTYLRKENIYCGYSQKRQLTAFLLEIFPGFGAGYFYIGEKKLGIIKCIIFIFAMFSVCIFPIIAKFTITIFDNDSCATFISIFFYILVIVVVFWYIYDLVGFGKNNIYDSLNYPLCSWSGSN